MYAWYIDGDGIDVSIAEKEPIHANNPHYAVLNVNKIGSGLCNEGYDGIVVQKNENMTSLLGKKMEGEDCYFKVVLVDDGGMN